LTKYWLPVLLWMALIFSASTDALSATRTSRILGPLLRWIHPGISDEAVRRVQYGVRKLGHLTEYAVLAVLVWRARFRPMRGETRPWSWPAAGMALGVAVLYAVSDEVHQGFVPTRDGRVQDVLLDGCGALVGLAAVWSWRRWRKGE
jgi:VanZ family protein